MTKSAKRTHGDRLASLREAFGRRKEIARQTGKKHDVSIAKICTDAKVDKTYLFGHRLKDNDTNRAAYLTLKNEILVFQNQLTEGIENSTDRFRALELEKKYKALLADIEPLQRDRAFFLAQSSNDAGERIRSRNRETELLARIAQLENDLTHATRSADISVGFVASGKAHVISPDAFRLADGKYRIGSKKQEQEAWGKAYAELESILSRSVLMRLYILCGLPCSGKSTWANEAALRTDRCPVVWDATNLTSFERYRFVSSISRFKDIQKTCVFFDTEMEVIRERNRTLRATDKRITDDELTLMQNKLEKPDPYEETWIDELIVVRPIHE